MIYPMDKERLKQYMTQMGIMLDEKQTDAFVLYYEMLIEKNKVMNLTAITEPGEVLIKHFADSLSPFSSLIKDDPLQGKRSGLKLLDVGTGAGFPAIPLKIAFPELDITMLDSLGKRVNFLNEVIGVLGLTDTAAIHGRAGNPQKIPGKSTPKRVREINAAHTSRHTAIAMAHTFTRRTRNNRRRPRVTISMIWFFNDIRKPPKRIPMPDKAQPFIMTQIHPLRKQISLNCVEVV